MCNLPVWPKATRHAGVTNHCHTCSTGVVDVLVASPAHAICGHCLQLGILHASMLMKIPGLWIVEDCTMTLITWSFISGAARVVE